MAVKAKRIFQVSKVEKNYRLQAVLDQLKKVKIELNQPFVYYNELCKTRNQFIHHYPDGRKFLIEQNQQDSTEKILKTLR